MGRAATAGFAGRRRGPGVLGLAVAVVVGGCTTAGPAPAPAVTTPVAPATSAAPTARTGAAPDFDGDGGADLVVGTGTRPGRVSIRYANGASTDLERQDVDPAHAGSADFGQALLARDLNGDGVVGYLFNLQVQMAPQPEVGLVPGPDGRAVRMSDEMLDQLIASGPDPDGPGVETHPVARPLPEEAPITKRPELRAKGLGPRPQQRPLTYSAPGEDGKKVTGGSGAADPYAGVGRNAPCPCGSGKKFKLCHGRAGAGA